MKKYLLLLTLPFLLNSCMQDKTKILPGSSGKTHNILLIMKDSDWKSAVGDSIRKYFAKEFNDLPQFEPIYSLQQADPQLFNGVFKKVRSIMQVKKGNNNRVKYEYDKYAEPQLIVTVEGKNNEEIKKLISQNASQIIDKFNKFEVKNLQQKNRKSLRVSDDIKKDLGISIEIPDFFNLVDHQNKFFWFRRDLKNGEADILLYEVPLKDSLDYKGDRVVKYRDSIGKKYIPGPTDSTYMKSIESISPSQLKLKIDNNDAVESRGLWDMKNDYMGGPYVNYHIIDPKNNRIVVGEGFIYAPAIDKRDYMVQLESILKTIKLDK